MQSFRVSSFFIEILKSLFKVTLSSERMLMQLSVFRLQDVTGQTFSWELSKNSVKGLATRFLSL